MRLLLARTGIVLLILNLIGCASWQATQVPLTELEGRKVRITTKEGKRQEGKLADADSLGFAVLQTDRGFKDRYNVLAKTAPARIDTAMITLVQQRTFNASRTILLAMSPVALVVGLLIFTDFPAFLGGED